MLAVLASSTLLLLLLCQRTSEAASLGEQQPRRLNAWPQVVPEEAEEVATVKRDNELGECLRGSVVRDICERCAKSTRSILAYPLCCEGSVNVRNWCQQFLSYTLDQTVVVT